MMYFSSSSSCSSLSSSRVVAASRKSRTQSPSSSSLFLKKTATTMRRRRRRTSWERSSSLIVSSAKPRALISVSDKTNLDKLASGLVALGFEVISTGGSAKFIQDKNIPVTSVDSVTSFPEMLDGRVKTLHPGIHGGILARRKDETHKKQISELGVGEVVGVGVGVLSGSSDEIEAAHVVASLKRLGESISVGT